MSIQIHYQTPLKLKDVRKIKQFLKEIALLEGYNISSLSIVFTSDQFLLDLNKSYLDHDYFTDILTFDYSSELDVNIIKGELYISVDRAKENSNILNIKPQEEYLRLMIHGILHLFGYKDENPQQKTIMTSLENKYLAMY